MRHPGGNCPVERARIRRLAESMIDRIRRRWETASLASACTDVFTPPEDLPPPHYAEYGHEARLGDAMRIRKDIERAVHTLGLDQHQHVP